MLMSYNCFCDSKWLFCFVSEPQTCCKITDLENRLKNFEKYFDEINPMILIDKLVETGIISLVGHQNITDIKYNRDKMETIVRYVLESGPDAFFPFYNVVKSEYPKLADKLLHDTANESAPSRSKG